MFRKIILIIIALSCALSIYSSDPDLQSAILVSDVPVTYGDESFRERILERTKGERDPIGLVLTGGSARAFAHLGVLEYLEKEGIVPDFIVSNSMGSIIAMLYAAGVSPEDIMDLLESVELSDLFTFTLPIRGGLLIPDGFEALVESVIGADTRLENLDIPGVMDILNKKSGVLGLSKNLSSDFRDLEEGMNNGNKYAKAAMEVFCYRVAKYIGSYVAAMNGVDAIAFTAGIGENAGTVRKMVVSYLGYLGITLDEEANKKRGEDLVISTADSKVKVAVIPTNEELAIARETVALV